MSGAGKIVRPDFVLIDFGIRVMTPGLFAREVAVKDPGHLPPPKSSYGYRSAGKYNLIASVEKSSNECHIARRLPPAKVLPERRDVAPILRGALNHATRCPADRRKISWVEAWVRASAPRRERRVPSSTNASTSSSRRFAMPASASADLRAAQCPRLSAQVTVSALTVDRALQDGARTVIGAFLVRHINEAFSSGMISPGRRQSFSHRHSA